MLYAFPLYSECLANACSYRVCVRCVPRVRSAFMFLFVPRVCSFVPRVCSLRSACVFVAFRVCLYCFCLCCVPRVRSACCVRVRVLRSACCVRVCVPHVAFRVLRSRVRSRKCVGAFCFTRVRSNTGILFHACAFEYNTKASGSRTAARYASTRHCCNKRRCRSPRLPVQRSAARQRPCATTPRRSQRPTPSATT
jgi:hypothetical protein